MNILEVKVGEDVILHDGIRGVVAINFELSLFDTGYEAGGWDDDAGGLLISASAEGLVRYSKAVLLENVQFYRERPSTLHSD